MQHPLSDLLQRFIDRVGLPVSRISSQAGIPKQTLFNWLGGRMPRWHAQLPDDLAKLALALGLGPKESDELLLAAGCVCAVDTPYFEETTMENLALPHGWHRAGSCPRQYRMGIDSTVLCEENASALICSRGVVAEGFGTLMQSCRPGKYLEKRVQLSAMIRTEDIHLWAGLWFRVDGPEKNKSLSFDNMHNRPLVGTQDWRRYSIVLDVPTEAIRLAYGILLSGAGKVWIADMRIETVGREVKTTNQKHTNSGLPDEPINLTFS